MVWSSMRFTVVGSIAQIPFISQEKFKAQIKIYKVLDKLIMSGAGQAAQRGAPAGRGEHLRSERSFTQKKTM